MGLSQRFLAPASHNPTWAIPAELDGRNGGNRTFACQPLIGATNDLEAIACWLAEFANTPTTFRNYRKEAERLVLWATQERGVAVSDLSREDLRAYQAFLADPQPREVWCGGRAPRTSPAWRPFRGPLGPSSQAQALTILNAMFAYLVSAGYLAGNPLALARGDTAKLRQAKATRATVERFLEHEIWAYLLEFILALPRETPTQRARAERTLYVFSLLYLMGPRVSELANGRMGDFELRRGKWWWRIKGKGGKTERVPANSDVLAALSRYRRFYHWPAMPEPHEDRALVLDLRGQAGISADMIYRIVRDTCRRAAAVLARCNAAQAAKLRRATTHWLRHTAVTHQADRAIELRYLNKSARHAKLETTGIYLHADEDQWHQAMERHRLGRMPSEGS
ncbi:integrase family protein [Salinisphaera sp. PC39]|uniref:tyrosine-type recombinase/integrase n=1 Tax=Salinisphaera sp. PC39 TaxID=1304156 RepID=UPI0033419066